MSEENQTDSPVAPVEGNATPSEPTFTASDIERILAADREQRTPTEPDDPVSRFRATAAGTKLYKPAGKSAQQPAQQQPQGSRLETAIESLIALQIASMKPPAPPAPPKMMSVDEKLASADPEIWLRRGNANQWTPSDRAQLVERHRQKLVAESFRGHVDIEAEARAGREISASAQRALKDIRVTNRLSADLIDALRGVR